LVELILFTSHKLHRSHGAGKGVELQITDALTTADTEHVIYFLLTAYVETLDYYEPLRSALSAEVTRLPLAGLSDIAGRLSTLQTARERSAPSRVRFLIEEAVEVFDAALQRIRALQNAQQSLASWVSLPLVGAQSAA
jgi:hypothetical protein